jgi:hypothetical protein
VEPLLQIRDRRTTLALLFSQFQGNETNKALIAILQTQEKALRSTLSDVVRTLGDLTYPFDHAKGQITLGQYLLPDGPLGADLGSLYSAAENLLELAGELYARVTGRLAQAAEGVEEVLGLKPLPETAQP